MIDEGVDHRDRAAPDDRARPDAGADGPVAERLRDGVRDALDPRAKVRLEH